MIPNGTTFFKLCAAKAPQSRLRHRKFLSACTVEEGVHSILLKKNVKIIKTIEVKDFKGTPGNLKKVANVVNYLCKKGKRIEKLQLSLKAISEKVYKLPFDGFRALKYLKSLDLCLMLYPGRARPGEGWSQAFRALVNSPRKLERLSLTFTNCYTIQEEMKECLSKVIRKKFLNKLAVEVINPPGKGNQTLNAISRLLHKVPHIQSFSLKGGYKGLKAGPEAYFDVLNRLYQIESLSNLDIDFDVAEVNLKRDNLLQQIEMEETSIKSKQSVKTVRMNVFLRENTFEQLCCFLTNFKATETLNMKLTKKDWSVDNYECWTGLVRTIEKMRSLKNLNIEYQAGQTRTSSTSRDKTQCSLTRWIQKKLRKLTHKTKRELIQNQNLDILGIFLGIPNSVKSLKNFELNFPDGSRTMGNAGKDC